MAHFKTDGAGGGLPRLRESERDPQARPQPEIAPPFFFMRNDHRFPPASQLPFYFSNFQGTCIPNPDPELT